jgi:collagenase-like PrtC family protease
VFFSLFFYAYYYIQKKNLLYKKEMRRERFCCLTEKIKFRDNHGKSSYIKSKINLPKKYRTKKRQKIVGQFCKKLDKGLHKYNYNLLQMHSQDLDLF